MENNKFLNKVEVVGGRIANNFYLGTVRDAFVSIMPVILVGSFAILFSNVIFSPTNGLAQFGPFAWMAQFQIIFQGINYATMNFLAIYLAFAIGMVHSRKMKNDSPWFGGLLSIISYVSLAPATLGVSTTLDDGTVVAIGNALASRYTNSQGMFLAIIVGILSATFFSKLMASGKVSIKMPDSVPPMVSKAFEVSIPALIVVVGFGLVGFLFQLALGMDMFDAIYTVLQAPLEAVMQHPAGIIVLVFIAQLFWLLGIHGAQLVSIVRDPVGFAALAVNFDAHQAGEAMPNIYTRPFWDVYSTMGGSGATLGLIIAIFLFSKREDAKAIGKLSLIPALFNINEPLIFGIPLVLNPIFAIPFILAPMVSSGIAYFLTHIGFATPAFAVMPWTTPPLLNAFLTTGSFGAVITQFIGIVASILIYIPFVKVHNAMAAKDKEEEEAFLAN